VIVAGAGDGLVTESGSRRRNALLLLLPGYAAVAAAAAASLTAPPAASALPLAPLGKVTARIGGAKLVGRSAKEVAAILQADIAQRRYLITGELTAEVFADDARFVDPTNDVVGLARYVTALQLLFDPDASTLTLRDIRVTAPSVIEADYELGGRLRFPWRPRVAPYEGVVVGCGVCCVCCDFS
jgi:hypothetical protein